MAKEKDKKSIELVEVEKAGTERTGDNEKKSDYFDLNNLENIKTMKPTRPFGYQILALLGKEFAIYKRSKGTVICQFILPILVILLVGIIHVKVSNIIEDETDEEYTPTVIYPFPVKCDMRSGIIRRVLELGWDYDVFQDHGGDPLWYMVTGPPEDSSSDDLGVLLRNGTGSGFLGEFEQFVLVNEELVPVEWVGENVTFFSEFFPYFREVESRESFLVDVNRRKQNRMVFLMSATDLVIGPEDVNDTIPFAYFNFKEISNGNPGEELRFSYEISLETQGYEGPQMEEDLLHGIAGFRGIMISGFLNGLGGLIDMVSSYIQGLPMLNPEFDFDISGIMAPFLFPFAISFLFPVFTHEIVFEKQQRLRESMKIQGLKLHMYWILTFVADMAIYILAMSVFIIAGLCFQLPIFINTSFHVTFILFLGWGLSLVSMSFLFSSFFSKARSASVSCYAIILMFIFNGMIAAQYWPFGSKSAPFLWLIWPPFAAYRGIYIMGLSCNYGECASGFNTEFRTVLAVLYVAPIFLLLLAVYLDQVLPKEFGIRKKPLFFIEYILQRINPKKFEDIEDDSLPLSEDVGHKALDSDVIDEENKILRDNLSPTAVPILLRGLRKQFVDGDKKKLAVKSMTLSINDKECFGLLGPNGAGKTTIISMLTGMYPATSGDAYLAGLNVAKRMDDIHKIVGVCPQFDTLWPEMSVRETLLFSHRLRGFFGEQSKIGVKVLLKAVNLWEVRDRLIKNLSGGMRRRCSIAVSLVGFPQVLFFDEPTTGLDPDSRRSVWNVLLQIVKERSVVLTTHSMEEADVLCTRIGIVDNGALECLGSSQHLKNKFGSGYILKLKFEIEDEKKIMDFIQKIAPSGEIIARSTGGGVNVKLSKELFVLSDFLKLFLETKSKENVPFSDWGISQSSLEDVFLNIVERRED